MATAPEIRGGAEHFSVALPLQGSSNQSASRNEPTAWAFSKEHDALATWPGLLDPGAPVAMPSQPEARQRGHEVAAVVAAM